MEKSIETIWKEGFLKSDALVAPKLNDLYNVKSSHIIDKFTRMYRINGIAIIAFAIFLLPTSIITDMPYMGIPMSVLFMVILLINWKFMKQLKNIDKGQNSYEYIKSFGSWIKKMIAFNMRLSRIVYPFIFVCLNVGFWFGSIGGDAPGDEFIQYFLNEFPNTPLILGFPIVLILAMMLIAGILSYFGERIGKWDINLVYNGILRKVDLLIAEMEELRA